jgi:hypothetical protein
VRDLLETTHACKLQDEEHQFSATISETRFFHWRRPHASIDHAAWGAARRFEGSYGNRQQARQEKTALLLFNSVRANVSTIYRISFARTQGRIETE